MQFKNEKRIMRVTLEDIIFSASGGVLFGAVAGYAIKKLIKIAAVVVGLFVVALAYLSYKDVKWITIENATKNCLTNMTNQTNHALRNTASHFQPHPSAIAPVSANS